ncbi:MAG: ribonuclease HII [Pseudomonadota bacterium]
MTAAWPSQPGIAGVDEAGRGPLAGPVVAAAVILPLEPLIQGLNDSKKLSSAQRDTLEAEIYQHAVAWGLGWASPAEIDAVNILQATFLAMRRALQGLKVAPAQVLVDGNRLPPQEGLGFIASWEAVVRGDSREAAIAAASILAKTARDRYMQGAEQTYPGYGFAVHKGYGTARHMSALRRLGVTPLHRRTFEPVKSMVLLLPSES